MRDRVLWWPLLAATLVVGVPAGLSGYGIGDAFPLPATWLLGAVAAVLLGIVFAGAMAWCLLRGRWRQAASYGLVILAYAVLAPPPFSRAQSMQQERLGNLLRFLASYPVAARPMRTQPPGTDGLVRRPWGTRGFAGMENDAYLVFDPVGRFSAAAQGAHPDGDFGLACPIVDTQPLLPPWVILTTYGCTLP